MSAYTVREPDLTGHHMVYNYPESIFAELATSCILHKEYDNKQYIGIYVYNDHISFINHNRPLPPVTIEDMNNAMEFRDRKYLNPELKKWILLKKTGFFEPDYFQFFHCSYRENIIRI